MRYLPLKRVLCGEQNLIWPSQNFSLQLGKKSVQLKLSALDHHLENTTLYRHLENTTLYRTRMEPEISTSSAPNWEKVETELKWLQLNLDAMSKKRASKSRSRTKSLMKWFDSWVSFERNSLAAGALSFYCISLLYLCIFSHSWLIVVTCLRGKKKPSLRLSAQPFQIRHQSEHSWGRWSHAMRSGWSLICFACSGQSSYQGNIIRQSGWSGNEKHSDGQCNGGVLSQWSLPMNE